MSHLFCIHELFEFHIHEISYGEIRSVTFEMKGVPFFYDLIKSAQFPDSFLSLYEGTLNEDTDNDLLTAKAEIKFYPVNDSIIIFNHYRMPR